MGKTYYDLLNDFYDLLEKKHVSGNAQLLYYTLLQINNRSGWTEWFYRTNISICGLIRISEKALTNAKNELKQLELIDFVSSKKRGDCTKYSILNLTKDSTKEVQRKYTGSTEEVQRADINKDKDRDKDKDKNIGSSPPRNSISPPRNELQCSNNININNNNNINNKYYVATPSPEEKKKNAKVFETDSIEFKLSKHLADSILLRNPNARVPKNDNDLFKWCVYIDYMLRLDKRPVEEVKEVLEFAIKDTFWSSNILSTRKLREQYDKLFFKMQNSKNNTKFNTNNSVSYSTIAKEEDTAKKINALKERFKNGKSNSIS